MQEGRVILNWSDSILNGKKHIHFIGIGGSGMYPLAQILHAQGYYLTGSDNNQTDTLDRVREMGIPVVLGQRAENIRGADLIVHTAAIMEDNPELIAARSSGVPVLERSDLLGLLSGHFQNAVCVSGTHGKTTTTGMLTQILLDAGADPTVVIGGKLPAIGGSGRIGQSQNMVCEACEFQDHFLKLKPAVSVILNIDEDHMEYFKTLDHLIASFRQFAQNAGRFVVANGDDPNTCRAVRQIGRPVVTFGFSEQNDYFPANIRQADGVHTVFDLMHRGEKLAELDLWVPGRHNLLNAAAACAAAVECGVRPDQLKSGLSRFRGTARRFEVLDQVGGVTVIDDYGHHPAEIRATLETAKAMPFRRVIAVHQPFTYSRTARLLDDFAKVLQIADITVLSEIMGSREKNTIGIYARDLAERIPGCVWFPEFEEIAAHVVSIAQPGDAVITLGCGDVNKCAHRIVELLKEKNAPAL